MIRRVIERAEKLIKTCDDYFVLVKKDTTALGALE